MGLRRPQLDGTGPVRRPRGGAAGGARVRDPHLRLRLGPEHHPHPLAGGQGRLAAARRRRLGRRDRRPRDLVVRPAQRGVRQRVPVELLRPARPGPRRLRGVRHGAGHRGGRRAAPHAPGDRDRDRRVHRDAAVDLPGPADALHGPGHHLLRGGGELQSPGGLDQYRGRSHRQGRAARDGAVWQRDDRRGAEHVAACRLPAADSGQRQRTQRPVRRYAERRLRVPAAGGLPPVPQLPAHQPLVGVPGHRDRHLPGGGRRADRHHLLRGPPQGRVIAMSWVVWRQYRAAAAITAALIAAFAALVVVTGVQAASQWHSALGACTASRSCGNLSSSTLFLGSHAIGFLVIMTLGVPAVLGILAGAPLLAHEFETGTNQYAWTQSVTRRRWLAVKAGWLLLAAAAIGGIVSALVTWWSGPDNALQANAFDPGRFDIMGIVPVGYAVFATALGITAGALLRRTLPAIAVTLAGFIVVRAVIFMALRRSFMTAVTSYFPIGSGFTPAGSAWQLGAGFVGANGQPLTLPLSTNGAVIGGGAGGVGLPVSSLPAACQQRAGNGRLGPAAYHAVVSCAQADGIRGFVTYQPASRYWAFQGIETGIFLLLAAALIAVAFAVVSRRDA